MLFEKYYYYLVKFDDVKTYWYRSNSSEYRIGTKVIVPISNNGIWKIGTVLEKRKCKIYEVPYPILNTKGIVAKAGWHSEKKVERHNAEIESSKYPPYDISVGMIKTERGSFNYITCQEERDFARESLRNHNSWVVIIENYPPVKLKEIPLEAQETVMKRKQEIIENRMRIYEEKERQKEELLRSMKFEEELEFEEEMEDLDQYN